MDDHSEDQTAAAGNGCGTSRWEQKGGYVVVSAETLPGGWTGKLWAMRQGVEDSAALSAEYLWFTDADIVHAPETLERLVARAEQQKLDLTSLMVLLQAKSFAERLLIPAFLYFFLKLYPPKWIADAKAKTAGAAGGCILLTASRAGTHRRNKGDSQRSDRRLRACSCGEASGGAIWMGLTRKECELAGLQYVCGDTRPDCANSIHAIGIFLTCADRNAGGHDADLYCSGSICVQHACDFVADWAGGVGIDDDFVSADGTILRIVAAVGADSAAGSGVLFYATWVSALRYWLGKGGKWKGRAQAPKK